MENDNKPVDSTNITEQDNLSKEWLDAYKSRTDTIESIFVCGAALSIISGIILIIIAAVSGGSKIHHRHMLLYVQDHTYADCLQIDENFRQARYERYKGNKND